MNKKKFCKVCNVELTRNNKSPYGTYCIPCGREYNKEHSRKYYREHGEADKEAHKECNSKFYAANPEYNKKYCEEHKVEHLERARKYQKNYPEKYKEATKKHSKKQRENGYKKKWDTDHPGYMNIWIENNPLSWKLLCRRNHSKRRSLGNISINTPFEGSHFHHFIRECGIYVPKTCHPQGHSHRPKDFEKLRAVNKKIFQWLNERPQENLLVFQQFRDLLEGRFGRNYFD